MNNPWVIGNGLILVRLLLSVLLGGAIGFEREHNHHPAGFRTHILVCLGSALIMMLSIYGFSEFVGETNVRIDPARLATAVITGIGFLGAGTILFTGKAITGLTTAASLWVVAAIGLSIGAGFYFAAVSGTALVLVNLWAFNKIERRFLRSKKIRRLTIQAAAREDFLGCLTARLNDISIKIQKMTLLEKRFPLEEPDHVEVRLHVVVPISMEPDEMIAEMKKISGVFAISVE
ncbi:MgtC/SapB family protein [Paenibacillus nasutitermitis]|uniref:Methyltransferase n=1 Tax=Paenibacillus nasutitermitis TaxID=1652958 RepID=A0A916ZG90_9BACL|nr:MgtC/SapB family protein [Paenibacillus nasutitermitis]GGD95902.1 methyltransferase [Paenibacillus nasutitermitis]